MHHRAGAVEVLFLDGDPLDYIRPGRILILGAGFQQHAKRDRVRLSIEPKDPKRQGKRWSLLFSTSDARADLEEREYLNTRRRAIDSSAPELAVSGDGRGCGRGTGKFRVLDIEWVGVTLKRFTAVFQHQCERHKGALRGCVHYEAPFF
jgi:hypothetical protein